MVVVKIGLLNNLLSYLILNLIIDLLNLIIKLLK